jgi:hypothetical protein
LTAFNLGLSSGAAFFGLIRPYVSWQNIFFVFSGMVTLSMATIYFIKTKNHLVQLEQLESNYLENLNAESSLLNKSEIG